MVALPGDSASRTADPPGERLPWRRFTPWSLPHLSAGEVERQGRVTRLAIDALGAQDAILFLNRRHDSLMDRPLAQATASEDGLQAVLRLLDHCRSS